MPRYIEQRIKYVMWSFTFNVVLKPHRGFAFWHLCRSLFSYSSFLRKHAFGPHALSHVPGACFYPSFCYLELILLADDRLQTEGRDGALSKSFGFTFTVLKIGSSLICHKMYFMIWSPLFLVLPGDSVIPKFFQNLQRARLLLT